MWPLAALVVLSSGVSLSAHDLWIEPTTFSAKPGDVVSLRLRVGQDLLGDPVARDARLVREFVVQDAVGRRSVVGRDGSDPAGLIRVASDGLMVIGYHSTPSVVDLAANKFNQYLEEEGLDDIIALRARQQATDRGARDAFIRCAKSLVTAGDPVRGQGDRALGLPLELVAERNPYDLGGDSVLPIRLTFEQRPVVGALVVAVNKKNPADRQRARTDRDGRVRFHVSTGGTWLIKAVHMIPATQDLNADWTSFWASLTFGVPTSPVLRPTSSVR